MLVVGTGLALIQQEFMKECRTGVTCRAIKGINEDSGPMDIEVLRHWTTAKVPTGSGDSRDVRYQVFQNGTRLFQEIRDVDDNLIHMLELPDGMAMNDSSYEVLCRYVLADVVNS